MTYDYIIIGAGITGITAAEQLANVYDKQVLLIDKNDHIGGQCYDYYNDDGILIHKYGPHIIHTNNETVYNYLSLFTNWNTYNHKIVTKKDDLLIPTPFNLISIEKCMPIISQDITSILLNDYLVNDRISLNKLKESDKPLIQELVKYIENNVYLPFLEKKYGASYDKLDENLLDNEVMAITYDCRCYQEMHQIIPSNGYTMMFENMLSNHNITILLEKDFNDIISIDYSTKKIYYNDEEFKGKIIYTGMIDEFFRYKYGKLDYRSAVLMEETIDRIFFQENATINYPSNKTHFSRITEYKYLTGQQTNNTTIQFEFPIDYNPEYTESNIPYYPLLTKKNIELYNKYKELTKEYPQIIFIGRLAQFNDINMDEAVLRALDVITNNLKEE